MTPANSYSHHWFEFFHAGIAEERTRKETDFICSCAPLTAFQNVLDVCCGMGRHARALAGRGYSVTGVERDVLAIEKARALNAGPEYVQADVRDYEPKPDAYDLVIIMSQSFGYFDASTNRDLLGRLTYGLRKGGRLILDLWNPEFFVQHQGEHDLKTWAGIVSERKMVRDGRLFVQLAYPDGMKEDFEWQLFTPGQMDSLAKALALVLIRACTGYNATAEPNPANPRIQFVLQKSTL